MDTPTAISDDSRTASTAGGDPRIVNGIEFFNIPGHGEDCMCARCGSSCAFIDCDNCGGEGCVDVECPEGWHEGDTEPCDWCKGQGGHWACLSSRAWCEGNPRPGREDQPVMSYSDAD